MRQPLFNHIFSTFQSLFFTTDIYLACIEIILITSMTCHLNICSKNKMLLQFFDQKNYFLKCHILRSNKLNL